MATAQEADALLPQTQCRECGYPGCFPYAQALVLGLAPIDKCPPGGLKTVKALAALMQIDETPYLADAIAHTRAPSTAIIREAECIGCTKCIKACPVDAIIGARKLMHTVITHECTGCGLCVEPCPVDCIDMIPLAVSAYDPQQARNRFNAKQLRTLRQEHEKQQQYREKKQLNQSTINHAQDIKAKQDYIQEALQRVKNKKNHE